MSHLTPPPPNELPSPRRLRFAALVAAALAVVIAVVIVLPAEKGIDPTGLGRIIGLTEMGEVKIELARELAAHLVADELLRLADSADAAEAIAMARDSSTARGAVAAAAAAAGSRADITTIVVPAASRREVVLQMSSGGRVRYSWSIDKVVLDNMVFGDSTNMERGPIHVYNRAFGKTVKTGVIVAAFGGLHGWFWRNTTDSLVTITLHTSGAYSEIREVK